MLTEKIPSEPTREQELDYLNWLEKSFSEDPWVAFHPKLYQPGPHRLMTKTVFGYRKEYRKTFYKNFLLSVFLGWPLIV
jgi:hypothetical protein